MKVNFQQPSVILTTNKLSDVTLQQWLIVKQIRTQNILLFTCTLSGKVEYLCLFYLRRLICICKHTLVVYRWCVPHLSQRFLHLYYHFFSCDVKEVKEPCGRVLHQSVLAVTLGLLSAFTVSSWVNRMTCFSSGPASPATPSKNTRTQPIWIVLQQYFSLDLKNQSSRLNTMTKGCFTSSFLNEESKEMSEEERMIFQIPKVPSLLTEKNRRTKELNSVRW